MKLWKMILASMGVLVLISPAMADVGLIGPYASQDEAVRDGARLVDNREIKGYVTSGWADVDPEGKDRGAGYYLTVIFPDDPREKLINPSDDHFEPDQIGGDARPALPQDDWQPEPPEGWSGEGPVAETRI